jgi:DNA-binding Lrp family transcriptional regulator
MSLLGNADDLHRASRFITNHPSVGWFSELHGSFSIGVALAISNPKQVDTFLKELISESDVSIYKKSIAFRLAIMDCPRQYLAPHATSQATHCIEDGVQHVITDSTDEAILQALTQLPDSSTREIGARLGMPHTTVDLRLRKLRASSVLLGHSLHIVPEKLGRQLHKLLVFTHNKSAQLSLDMRSFAANHPNVSHFVENIGEWDFEFNVEVLSLEDLRQCEYSLRAQFDSKINDIVTLGLSKLHSLRRVAGFPSSTK